MQAVVVAQAPPEVVTSTHGAFKVLRGSNLVFSAPHEMPQFRDGEENRGETGTAALAATLASHTGGSAIWTHGTQTGDPNWDDPHPYASHLFDQAANGICVDLHIMRPRGFEVCIGLGLEQRRIRAVWEPLLDELLDADVRISLNWPFGARGRTLTTRAQAAGIAAVQIEMIPDVFDPSSNEHTCVVSALLRAATRWQALVAAPYAVLLPRDQVMTSTTTDSFDSTQHPS
jgi:hypothetical protein